MPTLELAAGLEAFPGGGDLDAYARGIEVGGEVFEVGDDSWVGGLIGQRDWPYYLGAQCRFAYSRRS